MHIPELLTRYVYGACSLALLPRTLPWREEETAAINSFFEGGLAGHESSCLFLSGNPGSGKTTCLNSVLSKLTATHLINLVFLNAAEFDTPAHCYRALYSALLEPAKRISPMRAKTELTQFFAALNNRPAASDSVVPATKCRSTRTKKVSSSARPIVIVIDEIDHLMTRNQDIIYFLFDILGSISFPLMFVSIANTLSFVETNLRIVSRVSRIKKILFSDYSRESLKEILLTRLRDFEQTQEGRALEEAYRNLSARGINRKLSLSERVLGFFTNAKAMQLLVGRVESRGGDLRQVLQYAARCFYHARSRNSPLITALDVSEVVSGDVSTKQSLEAELSLLHRCVLQSVGEFSCDTVLAVCDRIKTLAAPGVNKDHDLPADLSCGEILDVIRQLLVSGQLTTDCAALMATWDSPLYSMC